MYVRVNLKTCEENGYDLVSTMEECESAARSIKLKDTTAFPLHRDPNTDSKRPHGCIYTSNDWLFWAGLQSTKIDCGSYDGHKYDCLCRVKGMKSS